MSLRARRTWSAIRSSVRSMLRETTAADSFWSDADLLEMANRRIDYWGMILLTEEEGFFQKVLYADLVANQTEYQLPEGISTVYSVALRRSVGSNTYEVILDREDRNSGGLRVGPVPGSLRRHPNARLVGSLLYLEPPPNENITDGLKLEVTTLPARLASDSSVLDLNFPDTFETLLEYEVWNEAMGIEDAQKAADAGVMRLLTQTLMEYRGAFDRYLIAQRYAGRTFVKQNYYGD